MKPKPLVMPALRGSFGDWIYYACLMPISDLGTRVRYADEVHPDKALSRLIQRSLEGPRAKHIATYLTGTRERFFSSLVLATYGGSPDWLEVGNFKATTDSRILEDISENAMDTLGFLRLSGSEKLFAIDGQHRLAGVKRAISEGADFGSEQVSVILVGHKKDADGMRRTRRLFTTLNKTAVPVRKRDIIALDEDDVMAITARRLVETNAKFRDPKIAVISSQSIPVGNRTCLTTIANLYDILKFIFMHDTGQRSDRTLRFNRPEDQRLDYFYSLATSYFDSLGEAFAPIGQFFSATNPAEVAGAQRGPHGGHLLFRPVGLEIFTRVAIEFAKVRGLSLSQAIARLNGLPVDITQVPYRHVLWDPNRQTIILSRKTIAREVLRYMAGLEIELDQITDAYRLALGTERDDSTVNLPARAISAV